MRKLVGVFVFWVVTALGSLPAAGQGTPLRPASVREFAVTENDTTTYVLKLALDAGGKPLYFFRNIFTPVCLTGECKPVYVNFYWDLLGNYTRYDLPPGKTLTKMDHEEFRPEDYQKLQDILSNPSSLMKDVAMEDLVGKGTEKLADSVDAKAGATLKTVKNEVIDGAVYTCYTLWHLAYGKAVGEMRKITETYRSDALLHAFLASPNHHYQYWAMEKVLDREGQVATPFEPDLLQIIRGKNLFTARFALQRLSDRFFRDRARQVWLWETFQAAGYPMQLAILKKLAAIPLEAPLAEGAARYLKKANQEQFRLILKLLATQPQLPDSAQTELAAQLENPNRDQAAEIYRVLTASRPQNRTVQQQLAHYQTRLTQTER